MILRFWVRFAVFAVGCLPPCFGGGQLPVGQQIRREIAPGEKQTYEMRSAGRGLFRIELEQLSGSLRVTLRRNAPGTPRKLTSELKRFEIAGPIAGQMNVDVELAPGMSKPGAYTIRLSELRPERDGDDRLFAAMSSFDDSCASAVDAHWTTASRAGACQHAADVLKAQHAGELDIAAAEYLTGLYGGAHRADAEAGLNSRL